MNSKNNNNKNKKHQRLTCSIEFPPQQALARLNINIYEPWVTLEKTKQIHTPTTISKVAFIAWLRNLLCAGSRRR